MQAAAIRTVPTLARFDLGNNYSLDLRTSRSFHLTEKLRAEIVAEGFNIFNHANYNGL